MGNDWAPRFLLLVVFGMPEFLGLVRPIAQLKNICLDMHEYQQVH
jgi:hypothetical protein